MKTNNTSNKNKKTSNVRPWEENVADDLEQWAIRPDSFCIEQFYLSKKIPKSTFYDGCARNEKLKTAHIFALEHCGVNRELLAIKSNANINSTLSFVLPHYLERWEKQVEWRNQLKVQQNQAIGKAEIEYDAILNNKKKDE